MQTVGTAEVSEENGDAVDKAGQSAGETATARVSGQSNKRVNPSRNRNNLRRRRFG
jgi:hypothetical protein